MSESFRRFVLEQLSQVAPRVRDRRMFGGLGVYSGELFFALVAGETLYLKVDDGNRADFEALGSGPFKPFPDKPMQMSYYDVPLEVLESAERLRPYVDSALLAAATAAANKSAKKRSPRRKRAE